MLGRIFYQIVTLSNFSDFDKIVAQKQKEIKTKIKTFNFTHLSPLVGASVWVQNISFPLHVCQGNFFKQRYIFLQPVAYGRFTVPGLWL